MRAGRDVIFESDLVTVGAFDGSGSARVGGRTWSASILWLLQISSLSLYMEMPLAHAKPKAKDVIRVPNILVPTLFSPPALLERARVLGCRRVLRRVRRRAARARDRVVVGARASRVGPLARSGMPSYLRRSYFFRFRADCESDNSSR